MKNSNSSIRFVHSKIIAQRLEDFGRVAGVTPSQLIDDILEAVLAPDPDGGWIYPGTMLESLSRYLHRKQYPLDQAKALAANYNAFALEEAQREGCSVTNEAQVEPKPNEHGLFRVWFPVIRSKGALKGQARKALQAAVA